MPKLDQNTLAQLGMAMSVAKGQHLTMDQCHHITYLKTIGYGTTETVDDVLAQVQLFNEMATSLRSEVAEKTTSMSSDAISVTAVTTQREASENDSDKDSNDDSSTNSDDASPEPARKKRRIVSTTASESEDSDLQPRSRSELQSRQPGVTVEIPLCALRARAQSSSSQEDIYAMPTSPTQPSDVRAHNHLNLRSLPFTSPLPSSNHDADYTLPESGQRPSRRPASLTTTADNTSRANSGSPAASSTTDNLDTMDLDPGVSHGLVDEAVSPQPQPDPVAVSVKSKKRKKAGSGSQDDPVHIKSESGNDSVEAAVERAKAEKKARKKAKRALKREADLKNTENRGQHTPPSPKISSNNSRTRSHSVSSEPMMSGALPSSPVPEQAVIDIEHPAVRDHSSTAVQKKRKKQQHCGPQYQRSTNPSEQKGHLPTPRHSSSVAAGPSSQVANVPTGPRAFYQSKNSSQQQNPHTAAASNNKKVCDSGLEAQCISKITGQDTTQPKVSSFQQFRVTVIKY